MNNARIIQHLQKARAAAHDIGLRDERAGEFADAVVAILAELAETVCQLDMQNETEEQIRRLEF